LGQNYSQLSQKERDQIAIYRSKGHSFSVIGKVLGRNGSTISREYNRNITEEGSYLPSEAQKQCLMRKSQAAETKSKCEAYESEIYFRLCEGWTPSQVAGRLSKKKKGFSISYETIYCFIYKYRPDWIMLLPRKHVVRWFKGMGKKRSKRDMIPDRVGIDKRPKKINNKTEFGHCEGDSIVCSQSTVSLNVMVERQTQYVSIRRVENRGAEVTKEAMVHSLKRFKKKSRRSITLDNGIEFKYHKKVKKALKMKTYFCQPYHSWEKGLVEQINGLIRRYLPKKTDLSKITKKEVGVIEFLLNSRPRKLLNWETPAEVFARKSGMKLVGDALAT
jgi:IS30 family transposase